MEIDATSLIAVVVLTVITVLFTGPGLWSEKWGWGWLTRSKARDEAKTDR